MWKTLCLEVLIGWSSGIGLVHIILQITTFFLHGESSPQTVVMRITLHSFRYFIESMMLTLFLREQCICFDIFLVSLRWAILVMFIVFFFWLVDWLVVPFGFWFCCCFVFIKVTTTVEVKEAMCKVYESLVYGFEKTQANTPILLQLS